ncbi:TonB-dependent receptor plug domain-containing protein [Massilia niastensis]|uniref:TonB-dependent receptor plug domain-containing protein n=1 Tax=Massilia niastensis TaxID=544911 RepID=UPI0003671BA0|nr:TonB-dependent receptor [Massilia niastensis]
MCSAAFPARAEDLTALSFDQLLSVEIVTASKFAQKLSEAPSAVSVVTAEDIETFGYRTLADILRGVRGVQVSYDRNYSYMGTRGSGRSGAYNSRVLLLVDGQRLNDSVYGQGSIGTEFPIDVDLIERVEYVPGPGSAIYGSNAFFGVLNIITKKPRALAGAAVGVELGSYRTGKAALTLGKRFDNGGEGLLRITGSASSGIDRYFPEFDDAASNHGVASGLDADRYQRLFAKYAFEGLTLTALFGDRVKGVPTASFGQQFNDPRSLTVDRYLSVSAAFQHAVSKTLDLHANLNFNRYQYQGDSAYTPLASGLNRDTSHSGVVSGELRFLSRAFDDHKLIYGIEAFNARTRRLSNRNVDPYELVLDEDHPKRGHAFYVQDEIRLGDRLILNAGLRHDVDAEGGHANSPRIGLIYELTPDVTTKLLYGTAFRSPNAFERYYITDATGFKSGPALRPEHIKTYEVVAEYFPRQDFRASASAFVYRLDSLISQTADPADQRLYFTNLDAASARGLELEAESLGRDGSRLKLSTAFQVARDSATGERLANSPARLAKLNYSRPFGTGAGRLGLEAQYTSRRPTILGGAVGGFTVLNLTLSGIRPTPRIALSASIYNLLDKQYADPPNDEHYDNSSPPRLLQSIRQDGRVFRMELSYRF